MRKGLILVIPLLAVTASAEPALLFSQNLGGAARFIEEATFPLGIEDETREIALDAFYIKTKLVSVEEYARYHAENLEMASPEYWKVTSQDRDQPVVGLDLRAIVPFLKWLGTMDSRYIFRLPTEAEWKRARRVGALEDADTGMAEFLFDRFSDSFEGWGPEKGVIRNPFGPIEGLNVVAIRALPGRRFRRGPIAPDHVGLKVGFRYAFSLSGPGPAGARMMKEALLKQGAGLPAGSTPPGLSGTPPLPSAPLPGSPGVPLTEYKPESPSGPPKQPAPAGGFTQAFGELVRLKSEAAAQREEFRKAHPAFELMDQAQQDPLTLACRKASAALKDRKLDTPTYEKVGALVQPAVQPNMQIALARVYGKAIQETLRTLPPRDAEDQRFYQMVGPIASGGQDLAVAPINLPYAEGSLENLVGYYLLGFELQRFATLWSTTVGRYPKEILEKEARVEELSKLLSEKYPREMKSASEAVKTTPASR